MSIGSNIRRIREERGLSQVELAGKIGVTQSMLCQIERGTKAPSLPLGKEIADALGCQLENLLTIYAFPATPPTRDNTLIVKGESQNVNPKTKEEQLWQ